MSEIPSGTVTFLFTDIEGSTKLWERFPDAMKLALARHDTLLRQAVESHGGYVFKTVGDAFCAAFSHPGDALDSSLSAQRALHAESWGETGEIRVRMALHTGMAEERDGDYFGPTLNRVARLMSAGHGGQILLSLATAEMVRDSLTSGAGLRDLGERRLKDLIRPEHVYQVVSGDLPADFPPLKTLDARPNNLPAQLTAFVGRERELAEIKRLLSGTRLLTLTGPGGTGKTRLALQTAADLVDEFDHGVYFVALSPIHDATMVASSIAQALDVAETPGEAIAVSLKKVLRERQLLLVLDNFEQVVDAAPLVNDLLTAAPGLKALVTTRERLHIYGEQEYAVPPLALPDLKRRPPLSALSQYEAVRLFIQRAQSVRADFQITEDNAPAIAEICVRLDGLPLAIELAAARVRLMTPQAIMGRLDKRLSTLTGGSRDLPGRQQTLRGAIDWSYDLLDEAERTLFARLGIFVAGWTLEAAEAVCGDDVNILDGLESLVNKSLVRQIETAEGEPRFLLLETIGEYAQEKLAERGESEMLRQRHATGYQALAERAAPEFRGPGQALWLRRLEADYDNLRLAWATTLQAETPDGALRFGENMFRYWYIRGYLNEGRTWLEQVIAHYGPPDSRKWAELLNSLGIFAEIQGDFQHSAAYYQQALEFYRSTGNQAAIARILSNQGSLYFQMGSPEQAKGYLEESLQIKRALGDKSALPPTLNNLSDVLFSLGDYATAQTLLEETLALDRERGNQQGIADSLLNLGSVVSKRGDQARAVALLEEALPIYRDLEDQRSICYVLNALGGIAHEQGQASQARAYYVESLRLNREIGDQALLYGSLTALAGVEAQPERACRLYAAVEAIRSGMGAARPLNEQDQATVAELRARLGEAAFSAAWTEGQKMTLEQAVAYALDTTQS